MALFERATRKGNGNSEKLSMIMGAPKSNSNLSDKDKVQLAIRRIELAEVPPPGLSFSDAFLKEMFMLQIKSVDATKDLQKKLEESNLMLALERLKCQEKEKRIQELNNNVTQLETDLQHEQDSHERTKFSYQQLIKLQQQSRNHLVVKDQQELSSSHNQRQKQQTLSKNHQTTKSTLSTGNNDNTKASEIVNKKTRGASSTTKPRTYRRHRNSRGPPLLSPAITPDTPFRNAKPEKVLERAIDKEQSGDNCEEDEELPSDVEADAVKPANVLKKVGVIEANSSTNLYNSYLNNKAPTTATAVLSALGKNYSYDPKVIGDISNAIHKTILNETLENENAKERARRSRRTNSGRRSRSSSSEGQMKTRRRRKSRGKSEKSCAKAPKERLFDSGNTKQLLQTLEKICQNRTVKNKYEIDENAAINAITASNANTSETNFTRQNKAYAAASNPQSNCLADTPTNQSRSRGRKKKNDIEDKCNEPVSSPPKASNSLPVRTITTRNSVARNLANRACSTTSANNPNLRTPLIEDAVSTKNTTITATPKIEVEVVSTSVSAKVVLSPDIVSTPTVSTSQLSKTVSSSVQDNLSFSGPFDALSSENLPLSTPGLTGNSPPSIASVVAAVSKINLPVSSTSAAIPKANSPGTSASAGLSKVGHPSPALNDSVVPKVTLSSDDTAMKINNLSKSCTLLAKTVSLSSGSEGEENGACKENNPGASLLKTALSSTMSKISSTDITITAAVSKSLISNSHKAGGMDPGKLKPATTTSSHIERINHGYTRNMNPLIKFSTTAPIADSAIAATKCNTPVMSLQHKEQIYNTNVSGDKTKNRCETISKYDDCVPVPLTRYTSDVKLNERENCMTTLYPYFVLDAPPLVSRRKREKRFLTPKTKEGIVEVPSWRIMEFNPLLDDDTSELEDTDEAIILKRHQKPEVDEKRRKRWDSQRMREETYLERLKRRMAMREKHPHPPKRNKLGKGLSVSDTAEESDDDMESFQPCIEDIRYIMVDEYIPIGTFGYPMPIVQKGCFDLPWSPNVCPNTATTSNNCGKSLFLNGYSPRRNGTIILNGCPVNNNMIATPTPPTLPNNIISYSSPTSTSVSSASSSNKEINVCNDCPSASTRQSKRL